MSQSSTIFNANDNSAFYTALKSRKSADVSAGGCKLLYTSESNHCGACRSLIETFPTNTCNYGNKVVYELANFGHLSEMFLKTTFGQNAQHSSTPATNFSCLTENAGFFMFNLIRIVADGVEVARLTPEYLTAYWYKHSDDAKRRHLQQLVSGWEQKGTPNSSMSSGANKSSVLPEERSNAGEQVLYTPLAWWFSAIEENMNRALPLGVLDRVFVEVEMNEGAYVNNFYGTGAALEIKSQSLISYITELAPDEERVWRASSIEAAGQPLTMLGRGIVQHIETGLASGSSEASHSIKLNMISGQISRLYVILHNQEDRDVLSSATGTHIQKHFEPAPINELILEANGVEIYKMENLCENQSYLENWVNRDYDSVKTVYKLGGGAETGSSWSNVLKNRQAIASEFVVSTGDAGGTDEAAFLAAANKINPFSLEEASTSSIDPRHIYVMSFKNIGADKRTTSATGSINFSNLSVPTIKMKFNGKTDYGGKSITNSKNYKAIVIAEQLNLVSIATNNAGRSTIRAVN